MRMKYLFLIFLTHQYNELQLLTELRKLRIDTSVLNENEISLPEDITIINKAFPKYIKFKLINIKQQIDIIPDVNIRNFFNLAFLSILESVSNTSKDGGFLRIINRNVNPKDIKKIFLDKCSYMISDVIRYNNIYDFNNKKYKKCKA